MIFPCFRGSTIFAQSSQVINWEYIMTVVGCGVISPVLYDKILGWQCHVFNFRRVGAYLLLSLPYFCVRVAKVNPLSTLDRHLAIRFSSSGCRAMASLTSDDALFRATMILSSATATSGRPSIDTNDT